jgi:alkylation response protein AidB-like acyl-CoA dehydrogenase
VSKTVDLELNEIGVEAAAGLREMLKSAIDGAPVSMYSVAEPISWKEFSDGGWDAIGISEADGGAGATLRDLVAIGHTWGQSVLPSPLITTIMAKRFSSAAREYAGPVSFAIKTRSSGDLGVIPFGSYGETKVLKNLTGGPESLVSTSDLAAIADDYADSLRLAEGKFDTEFTKVAAEELALVWASEAAGAAFAMLNKAVEYVKTREQFGQPIGKFQIIKHYLADAQMLVELAETATMMGALDEKLRRESAVYAFDASIKVIETAIQVHGGLGFTWEMGIHVYLRHATALRDLATEILS